MVLRGRRATPIDGPRSTGGRAVSALRPRTCAWCLLALVLILSRDFHPDSVAVAIAPYRYDVVSWELGNLPDKWTRRVAGLPRSFFTQTDTDREEARARRYFEIGSRLREIDWQLITLEANPQTATEPDLQIAQLRRERQELTMIREAHRPGVEETLESAVAETLREMGFKAWTGVFPPVDTVLTGSPTVLILSPRDRIERIEGGLMQAGLDRDQRERVETHVETETEWSALVVNTGGIALYPSITAENADLERALEVIAHEWVHQWLWFRPLGRRYFDSPDLATLNETVSSIAGAEIGQLALRRIANALDAQTPVGQNQPIDGQSTLTDDPPRFDFQAEMRATRVQVDALLAADDIDGAEMYMEERRRLFVSEGYPIRKLNQAYFAFHGTYATTGAAGINVIGEQVQELRRQSSSLAEFLRTAANFTSAEELAGYVERTKP